MAKRKGKTRGGKKQEEVLVDIVEVRDQAQNFIERNQSFILGGLAGILLLIGAIFAYNNFYKQPRQKEAVEQMFQAEFQFERDSFIQALTNPGGGFSGFLEIIDNYKGTPAANIAHYYAGISYLNLGQFDAAISYLNDFKPKGMITPIMKFGALGDAYAEKGDLAKAMSFYKKAANTDDNDLLTPYYLKKVGMLSEYQGDTKGALEAYNKIKEKYAKSAVASDIEKYIERVKTQG